ncbi:MAG: serine protease [Lachnospiraceae bacterium]|nr:serine protease [Lachnospiraceae bacterium]
MDENELQAPDNSEAKEKMLSFMHETTKQTPVNKRKLVRRTVITAFSALVFGVVACFTFLILEPVISNWLYPEEITKVKFPEEEDEVLPEEMLTENTLQQELHDDIMQQVEEMTSQGMEQSFTADSYEQLYKSLKDVADEAGAYMVTVKSKISEIDWMQDTIEKEDMASGVIVADNGVEYLILADTAGLSNVEAYSVSFSTGLTAQAELKGRHTPTGIGIFGVRHTDFSDTAKELIGIATLGNSGSGISVGQPIIAVGRPIGENDSVLYGIVSSKSTTLNLVDGVFRTIDTDMNDCEAAGGALINMKGEVIGLLTDSARKNKSHSNISAIGISDLKLLIEKLSNEEAVAYSGIRGMDVTKEAHDELDVPYGAYVTEVSMQSPCMEAGVLNGDIIVQMDETAINSFTDYKQALLKKKPEESVTLRIKRFTGEQYTDMTVNLLLAEWK